MRVSHGECVRLGSPGIYFIQKWAKNLPLYNQSKQVVQRSSANKLLCPVTTYKKIVAATPSSRPHLPMLHYPKTGAPISTLHIAAVWKKHLNHCGLDPHDCSLHSVRKLCMTLSHQLGFSELEIKQFGAWSSGAHELYIRTSSAVHINKKITKHLCDSFRT